MVWRVERFYRTITTPEILHGQNAPYGLDIPTRFGYTDSYKASRPSSSNFLPSKGQGVFNFPAALGVKKFLCMLLAISCWRLAGVSNL